MTRINANHSIFVIEIGLNGPVVSTFVDDIKIITLKNNEIIGCVKAKLTFAFLIVDMGLISFYLGLKVK